MCSVRASMDLCKFENGVCMVGILEVSIYGLCPTLHTNPPCLIKTIDEPGGRGSLGYSLPLEQRKLHKNATKRIDR